jgi:hypothetical protein
MLLDKIETLRAVERHGIRVVRAKYVDSAEEAIAFAARREMDDGQSLPIVLTIAVHQASTLPSRIRATIPLRDPEMIRSAYQFFAAEAEVFGDRVIAQDFIPPGTNLTIAGRKDDEGRKLLALRCGEHGLERLVPIESAAAESLAANVLAHDHRGPSVHWRRMLEHLVGRASRLFESPNIDSLVLEPIRLHENTYTVLDAEIGSTSRLRIRTRLARHAHDRRSESYHPAGLQ